MSEHKVVIDWKPYEDGRGVVNVTVNGTRVGGGGIGGEPEDNVRYRDYSWIEGTLSKLAKTLGASVEMTTSKSDDEDDDE